jgi:hypothetical protein
MGKGVVKGGTPIGSASLCKTCTSAHIMVGYRESEMITMCNDVHPNIVVSFRIYECSSYYDKNRPSWKQMEDLAITVTPAPLKPVGFKVGLQPPAKVRVGPDPDEAEEDYDND